MLYLLIERDGRGTRVDSYYLYRSTIWKALGGGEEVRGMSCSGGERRTLEI